MVIICHKHFKWRKFTIFSFILYFNLSPQAELLNNLVL